MRGTQQRTQEEELGRRKAQGVGVTLGPSKASVLGRREPSRG